MSAARHALRRRAWRFGSRAAWRVALRTTRATETACAAAAVVETRADVGGFSGASAAEEEASPASGSLGRTNMARGSGKAGACGGAQQPAPRGAAADARSARKRAKRRSTALESSGTALGVRRQVTADVICASRTIRDCPSSSLVLWAVHFGACMKRHGRRRSLSSAPALRSGWCARGAAAPRRAAAAAAAAHQRQCRQPWARAAASTASRRR